MAGGAAASGSGSSVPCQATAPPAQLAEAGLAAYRAALSINQEDARTRALELAVRCYQLAQKGSRQGGAKLYHPLGLAYDRLGRPAEAAIAFAAFLREVPESDRLPGVTGQINQRMHSLLRRLGQLDIIAPPHARLHIDDEAIGFAPLGHLHPVAPGIHVVKSSGGDLAPRSRSVVAVAGEVTRVELDTTGSATARHVVLRRAALGTLGAGVLLGAAGATLWALADRPTCGDPAGVVTCPQLLPPAGYGIALTALGVASVGASITLFVLSRRARLQEQRGPEAR